MVSRRPARKAPHEYTEASDFYGASAPATPPGGAWPPPPLWRSATPPMAPHSTFTPVPDDDPFPVPGGGATAPPLGQRRAGRSRKHWIGYPLTAVAALTVGLLGASPGEATPEIAAPVSQPTVTVTPTPAESTIRRRLTADPTTSPHDEVFYANCAAARAAGAAPLEVGDPGYRSSLDPDKDGKACN